MGNDYRKVDNGVIISSNIYSNFKSIRKETPMALMKVRGQKLIERHIEQLQECGIDDITIVIGEGVEDFEYLVDKYSVDLIHMVENLKGTLAPLYYAKDKLKNTYILNSTDYIKEGLYSEYENKSWHSIIETSKYTKKKVARMDRAGRIVGLKNGGYKAKFLYGPAFFTEEFSKKIKVYLEEYYYDVSRRCLDWQDVLLDNLDSLKIYGKERDYESMYTFDSMDELQRLDVDFKEDENKLIDIISNIMEVKVEDISNIVEMGHGMTNDSMLFVYDDKEYIIRVPGMGTDNLINRQNEYINYKAIRDLDISDRVIFMNNETGVKITKYEKGSRILDKDNEEELEQAFSILRKLHNSGLEVEHEFGLEKRLEFYEDLCREQRVEFLDGYEDMKRSVEKKIEILSTMEIPNKFCHIDSVDENFLVLDDGEMILIDWEYSSMGDPLIDLAMFCIHSDADDKKIDRIMEIYFNRKASNDERLRVYIYISMSSLLWYLWAEYKGALGEGFEDYKMRMFETSKKFSNEILRI